MFVIFPRCFSLFLSLAPGFLFKESFTQSGSQHLLLQAEEIGSQSKVRQGKKRMAEDFTSRKLYFYVFSIGQGLVLCSIAILVYKRVVF